MTRSQQGQIIACSVVWRRVVRHHITETMERTECFYSRIIPKLQLQCIFYSMWLTGSQLFLCQVHLFMPSSFLSVFCAWSKPPSKQKQRADRGFFIRLKDYIIWLSVFCVHIWTHTNLVADGRRRHTCTHTILSLSLFCLLKHALILCRQPVHTDVRMHTLSGDTTPTLVGKLDPQCLEAETARRRKRSVDAVMCTLFTPQLPVPSSSSSSFPPISKLQVQQSVESIHFPLKSTLKFLLFCLTFHVTRRPCWSAHGSQLYCQGHKVFLFFFFFSFSFMSKKTPVHYKTSAVSPPASWIIHLHELQNYMGTWKMSPEKCILLQGHRFTSKE